jgi:hypothetical protein
VEEGRGIRWIFELRCKSNNNDDCHDLKGKQFYGDVVALKQAILVK